MSRYKKVITGETELKEIGGEKFLIYPTMETRLELLELIKSAQTVDEIDEKDENGNVITTRRCRGVNFKMKDVAEVCAKVIYEGCWEHNERGGRIKKKEGEENTTYKEILEIVCANEILTIYSEILMELGVFDKEKIQEFRQKEAELKKKALGVIQESGKEITPSDSLSS